MADFSRPSLEFASSSSQKPPPEEPGNMPLGNTTGPTADGGRPSSAAAGNGAAAGAGTASGVTNSGVNDDTDPEVLKQVQEVLASDVWFLSRGLTSAGWLPVVHGANVDRLVLPPCLTDLSKVSHQLR
jgi:hypothetical protein